MVQLVYNCNLFHGVFDTILHFDLGHHFYRDLKARIMLVPRLENSAVGLGSKHFCLSIEVVILLQLTETLFSLTLEHSLLAE